MTDFVVLEAIEGIVYRYTPSEPAVLNSAPRTYRQSIAAVLQDDQLFAGSIADNIALFDAEPDLALIEQCARLAAIHDEIVTMPMRYETLVGDMGAALPGGQKQRVLLSRALYCRPGSCSWMKGRPTSMRRRRPLSAAVAGLSITLSAPVDDPRRLVTQLRGNLQAASQGPA